MGESLIKCPKDPKIQYYREVCTEIFRKGNLRKWCKHCEVFHDQKKSVGDAQYIHLLKSFKVCRKGWKMMYR